MNLKFSLSHRPNSRKLLGKVGSYFAKKDRLARLDWPEKLWDRSWLSHQQLLIHAV
jgi:hypothetical protein